MVGVIGVVLGYSRDEPADGERLQVYALASQYRWNGPPVVGAWDRLVRPPRSRRSGLRNEVLKIAKEPLLKAWHTVRMMAWRTPKSLNCVPFPQHTSKKDRGTIGSRARLLRRQGASG